MDRHLPFTLFLVLALSACDDTDPPADAGPGGDAGQDAGSPSDAGDDEEDAGGDPPDAGPSCTENCEFVELALGAAHSCALRGNGEVWCWGRNQEGQLGDSRDRHDTCAPVMADPIDCSSTPVQVMLSPSVALEDAIQIASDGGHGTCAIRESGELWCWGYEPIEQTEGVDPNTRFVAERVGDFNAVAQVAGWDPTCMVVGDAGRVLCYGDNISGEVGVGVLEPVRLPTTARPVVDAAGTELVGALEVAAAGTGSVSCARTADGVWCWGSDQSGQLGNADGAVATECMRGSETYGCSLVPVQVIGDGDVPLTDVASLSAGESHVCALRSGTADVGTVDCWGNNAAGQLGLDETITFIDQATQVTGLSGVAEIEAGDRFTCARLMDGTVQCWGFNHNGQLGDGVETHSACEFQDVAGDCSFTPVTVSGIEDAVAIGAGESHACAIVAAGHIWCWGYNNTRQLGDGSRDTSAVPVRVIGLPD